jgi:hypothetical protein
LALATFLWDILVKRLAKYYSFGWLSSLGDL